MTKTMKSCQVCNNPATAHCGKCKAVIYCNKNCQKIDFEVHKIACKDITTKMKKMENEKEKLIKSKKKNNERAPFDPYNIGRFWLMTETRPFMNAKAGYLASLDRYGTTPSLEAAETEAYEMLRLCRGDNLAIRHSIPGLLLRQENKEQECYDFIKWWLIESLKESSYDSSPFLSAKSSNMLEPVPYEGIQNFCQQPFTVGLMMVKLKLYHDLYESKHNFYNFSHGTIDEKNQLSMIKGNNLVLKKIFEYACYSPPKSLKDELGFKSTLESLEKQIKQVFQGGVNNNKIIWKALMNPLPLISQPSPPFYMMGSPEEAYFTVKQSHLAFHKIFSKMGKPGEFFTNLVGDYSNY